MSSIVRGLKVLTLSSSGNAAKHRGRNTVVEHGFVRIADLVGGVAMAS